MPYLFISQRRIIEDMFMQKVLTTLISYCRGDCFNAFFSMMWNRNHRGVFPAKLELPLILSFCLCFFHNSFTTSDQIQKLKLVIKSYWSPVFKKITFYIWMNVMIVFTHNMKHLVKSCFEYIAGIIKYPK